MSAERCGCAESQELRAMLDAARKLIDEERDKRRDAEQILGFQRAVLDRAVTDLRASLAHVEIGIRR